jgi:hypothetical protein
LWEASTSPRVTIPSTGMLTVSLIKLEDFSHRPLREFKIMHFKHIGNIYSKRQKEGRIQLSEFKIAKEHQLSLCL